MSARPILVTGAAGQLGSVGFKIVALLREAGLPVRAMVRRLDERAEALRRTGADVVDGDLTDLDAVHRAIEGCDRLYFGMSASPIHLQATINTAAVAKHHGVELFVNMSQMTVSQMNVHATTPSEQQKSHWLGEQALDWSGLPVVHLRPTMFIESLRAFSGEAIAKASELRLPFGRGRTSPVATDDVARVAATVLARPEGRAGAVLELTGPRSEDLTAVAEEFSRGLGRPVRYVDVPPAAWEAELKAKNLSPWLLNHFTTMAWLHRENRYDRLTPVVEQVTGVTPLTIESWVRRNAGLFGPGAARPMPR
jgi:uncharacterized protein YbjT (DUF2867 family)